jgi:hypothetical protein
MGPLDRALGLEIPGRVQWEPLEVQAQGPVQVPLDTPWYYLEQADSNTGASPDLCQKQRILTFGVQP